MKTPIKPFSKEAFRYIFRSRGRKKSIGELGGSFSLRDYKAYQYYRDNSKLANLKDIENFTEHGKIISKFYEIVGEKVASTSGGVFVDGLGYFGVIQEMDNKSSHNPVDGSIKLNPRTDNKIYNLAFVPIEKDNIFKPWVFDYSFSRKVKKLLCDNLKSGKKYTFNASLFFSKARKKGNDL